MLSILRRRLPNEGRLASEAGIEGAREGGAEVPGVRPGVASTELNPLDGAPRTLPKGVLLPL